MQVKSEPKINFFPLSHDEACEVPKSKLPFSNSLRAVMKGEVGGKIMKKRGEKMKHMLLKKRV